MPRDWWRFWRSGNQSKRSLREVRVVVWTRSNCPLCDEAAEFLEREQQKLGFQLNYADVDSDPDHQKEFGDFVPVVEVDGEVRFRGHINAVLWNRLVVALSRESK
jgi:glutaredoxin